MSRGPVIARWPAEGSLLSNEPVSFMRDPKFSVVPEEIAKLAARYDIDPVTFETIVADAAFHYHAGEWSRAQDKEPDTLDKVADKLNELLPLLSEDLNQLRLIGQLLHDDGERAARTFSEELVPLLEKVQRAAHKAHRRGKRGRPKERANLDWAYERLAGWRRRLFGDASFKNEWHNDPKDGLQPKTEAARFLYDVMKLIDPCRPGLAKSLRDLMHDTVKPFKRGRGRKARDNLT